MTRFGTKRRSGAIRRGLLPKMAPPVLFAGGGYLAKVLGTEASNLIAYWPLNEASGTNADNAEGTAARDGTYNGVTLGQPGIGDGETCPSFDGSNDYVSIYSDSLRDAFNGAAGTVALWAKVSGAGVWSDGQNRRAIKITVDGSNNVYIGKTSGNVMIWAYTAGGTSDAITAARSPTGWVHLGITWDAAADQVMAYYTGSQEGATQTGLGTWAGNIVNSGTIIGAENNTPAFPWDGLLAHVAVWTKALSAAQIASLAVV